MKSIKNKLLLCFIICFITQCNTIASTKYIQYKTVGNKTTYYRDGKVVGSIKTRTMNNGYIEVESCNRYSCSYDVMTPMYAENYRKNYYNQIIYLERYEKDSADIKRERKERQIREQKQKQAEAQFLASHKALVKKIDDYNSKLPNLDFKLGYRYKVSNDTILKDTYKIYTAPKKIFDLIPESTYFDKNLQYYRVPRECSESMELCLGNIKKPLFKKTSLFYQLPQDKVYRFMYIKEGCYKDPSLSCKENSFQNTRYFENFNKPSVNLNDVKVWFEEYKKFLAPYIAAYEQTKKEVIRIEDTEDYQTRYNLTQKSNKLKKKYPNKTLSDLMSKKKKSILMANYNDLHVDRLTYDQVMNFKVGHIYSYDGSEINIQTVSKKCIKNEDYLLADKDLLKELFSMIKDIKYIHPPIESSSYMTDVQNKIGRIWNPSTQGFGAGLKTIIEFTLNKEGYLIDYNIIKKSGSTEFDQEVLNTLWRANHFNKLPDDFPNPIKIRFTFSTIPQKQNNSILPVIKEINQQK